MKKGLLLAACLILVFIAIGASGCTDYFGSGGDERAINISLTIKISGVEKWILQGNWVSE